MNDLPSTVVIAGHTFGVFRESREALKGDDARLNSPTQQIRLADDMAPDTLRDSLLHEILHAIHILSGLPRREREVGVMAVQILDVLRCNPALVGWLTEP